MYFLCDETINFYYKVSILNADKICTENAYFWKCHDGVIVEPCTNNSKYITLWSLQSDCVVSYFVLL